MSKYQLADVSNYLYFTFLLNNLLGDVCILFSKVQASLLRKIKCKPKSACSTV